MSSSIAASRSPRAAKVVNGFSFDPIIAFGSHAAMPHHEVSIKKKLRKGDMILIDMETSWNQSLLRNQERIF